MRLAFAFHLFAAFFAVQLYALVGSALALPIPALNSAYASQPQSVVSVHTLHKRTKKPSGKGKKSVTGPPGPPSHLAPRPLANGQPLRPNGPHAYLTKPLGQFKQADKHEKAFLGPESKIDGGKMLHASLQNFDRGGARSIYAQSKAGLQYNAHEHIHPLMNGNRIDRQGGHSKDQEFNIQAQTNGDDSISFAAAIGWKGSLANSEDVHKGLQASAREGATVHLVSPDWIPPEGAPSRAA